MNLLFLAGMCVLFNPDAMSVYTADGRLISYTNKKINFANIAGVHHKTVYPSNVIYLKSTFICRWRWDLDVHVCISMSVFMCLCLCLCVCVYEWVVPCGAVWFLSSAWLFQVKTTSNLVVTAFIRNAGEVSSILYVGTVCDAHSCSLTVILQEYNTARVA